MITVTFSGESWQEIKTQLASWQEAAKCPTIDAKEDKYMPFGRSVSQQSHSELRGIIAGYLADPSIKPSQIRDLLASEHDIQISPQKLGGYVSQINRQAKMAVKPSERPIEAKSPRSSCVPLSEPEVTIYGLLCKHVFPSEIRACLQRKGYHMSMSEIERIVRGFA